MRTESNILMTRPMSETRFWGNYLVLDYIRLSNETAALTKRLHILKGKSISYQLHKYRNEIWTIAKGQGIFVYNGEERIVYPGDSLQINKGDLHAIKATSDLVIIEVQLGFPLVEEDIVRFNYEWKNTV